MIYVEHKAKTQTRITNYPAIGITQGGLIVLFSSENHGTVLVGNDFNMEGDYDNDWEMTNFFLLPGEITLRNT